MSVPVWVEQENGKFVASALGVPGLVAEAETRESAIAALKAKLELRAVAGQLLFLDVENRGVLAFAGKYKDDPDWHAYWDEIVREVYRYRDELKAQEFPE